MLRLFRCLQGYVTLKLWGYSPERFLNLCSNHHILIWNVTGYPEYYILNMSVRDFFTIQTLLRKTKTKVRVIQRYGLPFFIEKRKKRKVFFLGILCCFLFLFLMSRHIWSIQVEGNRVVTKEELLQYLKENEISYGTLKSSIDTEELEKKIRKDYDTFIWASVKIKGTRMWLQVKERITQDSRKIELASPTDLIATCNGRIVKMVTRTGVPMVKTGDTITKGQLLVSGLIPILNEGGETYKYQYENSSADILVKTSYPYKSHLSYAYQEKEFTGKQQKTVFFRIGSWQGTLPHARIPFSSYDTVTALHQVHIMENFYLPIYLGIDTAMEYRITPKKYGEKEAIAIENRKLERFMESLEKKGIQILKKDVKMVKTRVGVDAVGTLWVYEKTGTSKKSQPPETMQENGN